MFGRKKNGYAEQLSDKEKMEKIYQKMFPEEQSASLQDIKALIEQSAQQGKIRKKGAQKELPAPLKVHLRAKAYQDWLRKPCKNGCTFCEKCREEFEKIIEVE